jgi:hypothetical protein
LEIHTLVNSIWNKEVLPWIVSIYKEGNKTHCSNYYGISLLSTS